MEIWQALLLGLVQGFTEFLPVSSSGHLAVVSKVIGFSEPGLMFEVVVHAGTLLAVLWYFRNKIASIGLAELKLIIVGSIPAFLVGVLFHNQVENLFSILSLVALAFLVTAYFNYKTDKFSGKRENLDFLDALIIGAFQAFAVIPGISRSGSTIFAASKMNISKAKAAEFSFLLSIPAIVGANALEYLRYSNSEEPRYFALAAGFMAAFVSGLFAINILFKFLAERKLKYFAYYLVALALFVFFVL